MNYIHLYVMKKLKNLCLLLPDSLGKHICDYLYYSKDVHNAISPCLYIINNYPNIIMREIIHIYSHSDYVSNNYYDFYKMFLRWINLDKNIELYNYIQILHPLDYDMQDKTRQIESLLKIMSIMNMFQIQDYYNYMYH